MEKFGNLVYESLKTLIDEESTNLNSKLSNSSLVNELLTHAMLCNQMIANFLPRENYFEIIRNYVINDNMFPFVIYGDYGVGKSSLLAQLITNVSKRGLSC